MRSRFARLGVLAAGLLGLLGATMPAAEATSVGAIEFVLNATVDGGNNTIAYPCMGGLPTPVGLPDLTLCVLVDPTNPVTVKSMMLPKSAADVVVNVNTRHNPSTVSVLTKACVGVVVNVNKLSKAPVDAGPCAIGGTGIVWGHCGLSTGTVSGVVATPTNAYGFTVKFTGIGGNLIITGHVTLSTGNGWIRGVAVAIPDPTKGSCTTKHPLGFLIVGSAVFLMIT